MGTAGADAPARVGIFGGTFDPPHVGHVTVARDVADALDLHEVWWMVADRSPFKTDRTSTPAAVRLEMARAAAGSDPRFRVRDDELRRGGVSYTVDTMHALTDAHPHTDFHLIVGADQAADLDRWHDAAVLLDLVTLVVMDRAGVDAGEVLPSVPGADRALHVAVTPVPVSSTGIRAAVRRGEDVGGVLPEGVAEIVRGRGLYRT